MEISEIRFTEETHVIQFVAKDEARKILVILTWDFDNEIEKSMFQIKYADDQPMPEKFMTKGLNQRMNYFEDDYMMFDLEFNIAMQKTTSKFMD